MQNLNRLLLHSIPLGRTLGIFFLCAATATAFKLVNDPDAASNDQAIISQAVAEASAQVAHLARTDPSAFAAVLHQAFGARLDAETKRDFVAQAANRRLPFPADIRFVAPEVFADLNATAAYASENGGEIFLHAGLRSKASLLPDVILHEWGHHLDAALGAGDAPGEEGDIFLMGSKNGGPIPFTKLRALAFSQGRCATIEFEGRIIPVELGLFDIFNPVKWVETVANGLETVANVAKGATLGVGGLLAKATGNDNVADALFKEAGVAIKSSANNVIDAVSAPGNFYNQVTTELDKVVPGLGTGLGFVASFTPAGLYIAGAKGVADVKNAVENGGNVFSAVVFATVDIGGSAISKLNKGVKAAKLLREPVTKIASNPGIISGAIKSVQKGADKLIQKIPVVKNLDSYVLTKATKTQTSLGKSIINNKRALDIFEGVNIANKAQTYSGAKLYISNRDRNDKGELLGTGGNSFAQVFSGTKGVPAITSGNGTKTLTNQTDDGVADGIAAGVAATSTDSLKSDPGTNAVAPIVCTDTSHIAITPVLISAGVATGIATASTDVKKTGGPDPVPADTGSLPNSPQSDPDTTASNTPKLDRLGSGSGEFGGQPATVELFGSDGRVEVLRVNANGLASEYNRDLGECEIDGDKFYIHGICGLVEYEFFLDQGGATASNNKASSQPMKMGSGSGTYGGQPATVELFGNNGTYEDMRVTANGMTTAYKPALGECEIDGDKFYIHGLCGLIEYEFFLDQPAAKAVIQAPTAQKTFAGINTDSSNTSGLDRLASGRGEFNDQLADVEFWGNGNEISVMQVAIDNQISDYRSDSGRYSIDGNDSFVLKGNETTISGTCDSFYFEFALEQNDIPRDLDSSPPAQTNVPKSVLTNEPIEADPLQDADLEILAKGSGEFGGEAADVEFLGNDDGIVVMRVAIDGESTDYRVAEDDTFSIQANDDSAYGMCNSIRFGFALDTAE